MTEEKIETTQENPAPKKKKLSLKRIAGLFVVVCVGYFGLRHFEIRQAQKLNKSADAYQPNIESEIFDLAEEYKNGGSHDPRSDLALSEVQEKGAEFVYKMLLKNQEQINDLREQSQSLRAEFIKYKNHENLGKMIVAYVDFRQKLLGGEVYEDALKNFEMLSVFDQNLSDKITKMRASLKNFSDAKRMQKDFSDLIPIIIAAKSVNVGGGFFDKVRYNVAKLVVIRRVDGKNPNDVDGIIVSTEKLLHDEKYQEALGCLLMLDQSYHDVLVDFLNKLSADAEVKKIDSEILSYLKNLS